MTLAAKLKAKIIKLPVGQSFGYADLGISKNDYQTAAKALERMQTKGVIKKMSKGIFYKPKQTVFGELKPDYSQQLRSYLFENRKRIAYETGVSLYNRMGLTTQVAFRIKIASRSKRISVNRGAIKANAVKSYVEVTDANYELLGFLDAIKDIKRIPDCSVTQAIRIISSKISNLNKKQIIMLMKFALLYPPRVRALVGAILENISPKTDLAKLQNSLNPLTKIKLGIKESDLPTIKNWNLE